MSTVTSRDGTTIGFDRKGNGPALVVVTGATQYRAVDRTTPVLAGLLADDFTVVSYDRRGRGESGEASPYAVAREIEDIEALIDANGGEALLFGMSSGAVLVLEAAAALRAKVRGAVLYEPPVNPDQSSADSWRDHAEMAALLQQGRAEDMMIRFLEGVGMSPEALAGFRASPAWPAFASIGATIEHDYRILAEATDGDRHPARWRQVTAPVLVVDGDASFPFMAGGADWVAAGVPGAERRTLAGQGHDFDPAVVAPVVRRFLARMPV